LVIAENSSKRQLKQSALWSALSSPYFVPVCFLLYLSLRLSLILAISVDQYSDNLWYYARAVGLATGQGYSEGGIPTAYWPPGWPGFLGLLFSLFAPSPLVGQVGNLVLSAIIFFLALSLGSNIFADKLVGRLTAALLTIYPNQIGYVPVLSTEIFYTVLLLLGVFIIIRAQSFTRLLLAGVVFGIATLTKAQTLFLPALLFAAWWLSAGGRPHVFSVFGRAALVYGAMTLVILPWTVRNYTIFGDFVLISTNGGGTLLSGNNPSARGDYTEHDALVQQVPNDVAGQVANDRLATALAIKWIHDNPLGFALLIPQKVWRLWAPDGEAEWSYQAGFKDYDKYWVIFRLVRGVNQVYYSCLILLSLLSLVYFFRQNRTRGTYEVTGYALIVYFTAISMVFSGQSRFHYSLMPWITMYAAWTVTQWSGRTKPAPGSSAALGA
jgi:hypothetical protein